MSHVSDRVWSFQEAWKLTSYLHIMCNMDNKTYCQRLNRLTPKDPYVGRTAPLTSKRCILYIYSTNKGTEHFKHALYSPFFSLQNAVCFIMLTCLVPVLFTFYIQDVLKLKKNNSDAKRLKNKQEEICAFKTSVPSYQTRRCHDPEQHNVKLALCFKKTLKRRWM